MSTFADGTATIPLIIDGELLITDKTFDVVSPVTGKLVHRCCGASSTTVQAAVDAASRALKEWRQSTPGHRRNIFLRAAQVMEKRRGELAQCMMLETGASQEWADFNVDTAIELILDIAGRIATIEGSVPQCQDPGITAIVLKQPFGVVLAIAPWNAPYILGTRSISAPIAAGNTAILKGSELSPKTMHSIVSVFQEAGLPRGVLNFLAHDPRDAALITEQLISNPLISKVNFTGSTAVGRVIGRLAGHHLKPVLLELGGKAPVIICEDADLEAAAQECVVGAFLNSGQICMSTERILVHSRIRVQFEQRLIDATERMFGALDKALLLINSAAVARCKNLLEDAVSKGASLVYGDVADAFSSPAHMRPVVISGVTKDMEIYRTESFGPSVSLFVFESEEEALELANDTDYGLSSAIFTRDLARGLKLARGIESGAVHINSMTVHDESALPHGGVKASGFGRFNASGLEEWTQTKTITFRL